MGFEESAENDTCNGSMLGEEVDEDNEFEVVDEDVFFLSLFPSL